MKKIFLIASILLIFLTSCGQNCEHDYESKKIEVTCTEDGYTLYTCNLCGDSYKGDIVPSTGHQTKVSTPGYAPTCEESGMTDEYSCTICNKLVKPAEKIFALGHEYGKWVEATKPTKETTGLLTKTCEIDKSHVQEIVLPKLIKCDDYVYEINNPTCTSEGLETFIYKADEQEFKYEVVLEKLPHTYNEVVTAPTCLEKGYTTYTCSCGDTYVDDYVNATGHSHTSVVTKPTCIDKGYTTHTCHCGDTYVDTYVDATGHSHVKSIVDPTCTEKGYTAYTCHCGDIYKDTYVDALGHKFINYVDDNNPGCETNETKTATCENGCGSKDVKEIEGTSIGHAYGEWKMTEEPSLTKAGLLTKYCENDQSHTITKVLPMLDKVNYNFSGTEPTCTSSGNSTYECEIDGQNFIIKLSLDALGHSYTSVVKNPTCLEKGYTTYTCHCGYTYIDNYVDSLGHNLITEIEATAPTCKNDGSTEQVGCSRCDYIESPQTVVPATGHKDSNNDYCCDVCGVPYGENVVKISTYEQLKSIKNNPTGFYELVNNIDATGKGWDNDFAFYGYLYGNGYCIKGLFKDLIKDNYGTIDSLKVSDFKYEFKLDDTLVYKTFKKENKDYNRTYGFFTINNYGTIKNCEIVGSNLIKVYTKLNLDCGSSSSHTNNTIIYFGGFAGYNYASGKIENCDITGVVTLDTYNYVYHVTSGISVYNGESAKSYQTVYFGGLAGMNEGSINNCEIKGYVSVAYYIGVEIYDRWIQKKECAIARTKVYVGIVASVNKGTIDNVTVYNKLTKNKDSNSIIVDDLYAVGATATGGRQALIDFISVSNYENLIGQNSGTITNISTKY